MCQSCFAHLLIRVGGRDNLTLRPALYSAAPTGLPRGGSRGRFPNVRYRQGRTRTASLELRVSRHQAQVTVCKTKQGRRLVRVETQIAHGSSKRVARELSRLGFEKANTSTIERRNGTARGMDATSVRKTLAFAKTAKTKRVLGAWGVHVYNWARECRSLKRPLSQPQGRQLYERRSPAMAAGLTDHIWSVQESLRSPTYPSGGRDNLTLRPACASLQINDMQRVKQVAFDLFRDLLTDQSEAQPLKESNVARLPDGVRHDPLMP